MGLVFGIYLSLYSSNLYFIVRPVQCSKMSGFVTTSLCVMSAYCSGWKLRVSFLPSTASSLCCKEDLEGPSMCL